MVACFFLIAAYQASANLIRDESKMLLLRFNINVKKVSGMLRDVIEASENLRLNGNNPRIIR